MQFPSDLILPIRAAEIYGCTRGNISHLMKAGKLEVYRFHGVRFVKKSEVVEVAKKMMPRGKKRGKTAKKD